MKNTFKSMEGFAKKALPSKSLAQCQGGNETPVKERKFYGVVMRKNGSKASKYGG